MSNVGSLTDSKKRFESGEKEESLDHAVSVHPHQFVKALAKKAVPKSTVP
jgi:hypothetical protein